MPLLPLATPAGRKEHHLVGHGDEENSNTTLIEKAPVHNVLRSELPPKELTGEQPGPPPNVVRERQRKGNHQATSLRRPNVAIPSLFFLRIENSINQAAILQSFWQSAIT
jgi:hypothetical protein